MGSLSGLSGNSAISGLLPMALSPAALTITNTITVNWDGAAAPIQPYAYGVNAYQAFDPAVAQNPGYRASMNYLNPALVRYHNRESLKDSITNRLGWVRNPGASTYSWDRTKISQAVTGTFPNREKMITIYNWPAALADELGRLKASKIQEYADFCRELIQILNAENGAGFTHLTLLNELEGLYPSDMSAVGQIYNACHDLIKQDFPDLKIGGPGITNIYNTARVDAFLAATHSKLDYFTFHAYTTGHPTNSTRQGLWHSGANSMRTAVNAARSALQRHTTRSIPLYFNEFGLSYAGPFPQLTNEIRAIWEALALISLSTSAAKFTGAWNECDDWFGLCDRAYNLRSGAHIYHLFNSHFKGDSYPTTATGSTVMVPTNPPSSVQSVAAFATRNQTKRSIALVNRSELSRGVRVQMNGWVPGQTLAMDAFFVSAQGITAHSITAETFSNGLQIPANMIVLIIGDE
jgi:Glycosyl hydrolases family 39